MTHMGTFLALTGEAATSASQSITEPLFSGLEFPHEELRDSIHSNSFWFSLGALRSSGSHF